MSNESKKRRLTEPEMQERLALALGLMDEVWAELHERKVETDRSEGTTHKKPHCLKALEFAKNELERASEEIAFAYGEE